MPLIDLSHAIVSGMPQWPGDDSELSILRRSEHGPDGHLSSALSFGCHVGTHIDTPYHFLDGQPGLEEMDVTVFCGRALRVDVTDLATAGPELIDGLDLTDLDFLLLATGWERHWGTDRYYDGWPVPSAELAAALAAAPLKGVGVDTPSLDAYGGRRSHDLLAAAGRINIENLANLGALPATPFEFFALPLKLAAAEASPVRAVARI